MEQLNFNSSGYLTSDVDRNGDTLTYTMSGTNLSSITDTQGRTITFAYGSTVGSNLITSITDATGREWQYAYTSANGFDELTQYTDPNGKVTTYAYGTRGQLTMITDPSGQRDDLRLQRAAAGHLYHRCHEHQPWNGADHDLRVLPGTVGQLRRGSLGGQCCRVHRVNRLQWPRHHVLL